MENVNLFQLLPEEILETILDLLDDSDDIINALGVFPELRYVCHGKEYAWLIGDLLPLLFPKYLDFNDIKLCRLVSKSWNKSVERTLETHPDRLPYKSPRLTRITESHFNYSSLPPIQTNFHHVFLSQMGLPISENPFPGRCVHFTVNDYQDDVGIHARLFQGIAKYLPLCEALPVMRFYGYHIWYMTFEFTSVFPKNSEVLLINLVQSLCGCLYFMPNLKSLKLISKQFTSHDISKKGKERLLEIFETTSISFHLETLDLSQFHDHNQNFWHKNFVSAFVRHDQVRKLGLYSANWDNAFKYIFPNLSELSLNLCRKKAPELLEHILQNLNTADLRKLGIILKDMNDLTQINDLLKILGPFKIESLQISSKQSDRNEGGSLNKIRKAFASLLPWKIERNPSIVNSIHFLRIEVTSELKYSFLTSFPFLTHLTLDFYTRNVNDFDNTGWDTDDDSVMQTGLFHFYEYKEKYGGFNKILGQFPNLEMLTVSNPENIFLLPLSQTFTRETATAVKPVSSSYFECMWEAKFENYCGEYNVRR